MPKRKQKTSRLERRLKAEAGRLNLMRRRLRMTELLFQGEDWIRELTEAADSLGRAAHYLAIAIIGAHKRQLLLPIIHTNEGASNGDGDEKQRGAGPGATGE
jgi:hypothetical protein